MPCARLPAINLKDISILFDRVVEEKVPEEKVDEEKVDEGEPAEAPWWKEYHHMHLTRSGEINCRLFTFPDLKQACTEHEICCSGADLEVHIASCPQIWIIANEYCVLNFCLCIARNKKFFGAMFAAKREGRLDGFMKFMSKMRQQKRSV